MGDSSPPPGMVATRQTDPGEPAGPLTYEAPSAINPPKGAPPTRNPPYLMVQVRLTTTPLTEMFDVQMARTVIDGHRALLGRLPVPEEVGYMAAWRAGPATVVWVHSSGLTKAQFLRSAGGVFYRPGTLPPLAPAPSGEVPPACRRLPPGPYPPNR